MALAVMITGDVQEATIRRIQIGEAMPEPAVTYDTHAVFVGGRLEYGPLSKDHAEKVATFRREKWGDRNVSVVDLSRLKNTDRRVYIPITGG